MKRIVVNGKEPSIVRSTDFDRIILSIFRFFKEKGMGLKPYPNIIFDCKKQHSLVNFCIGYYNGDRGEVRIFVKDRSPNDIVRTIFHEFVHHWQKINGSYDKMMVGVTSDNADVGLHKGLTKMEREANDKGFCMYREWARLHKGKRDADAQFDMKSM